MQMFRHQCRPHRTMMPPAGSAAGSIANAVNPSRAALQPDGPYTGTVRLHRCRYPAVVLPDPMHTCPGCVPLPSPVGGGHCRPKPVRQCTLPKLATGSTTGCRILPGLLPSGLSGSRSGGCMSRRPLAGGFRLLCETGAAIGAAPIPPLPSAPSGTRATILKKCDVFIGCCVIESGGVWGVGRGQGGRAGYGAGAKYAE
jgi:hypothetical protein